MHGTLLRSIVRPLIERVGTMVAAYLIARGVDSDAAAQLLNGLTAAALVLFDLVFASFNRARDEHRLMTEILSPREDD